MWESFPWPVTQVLHGLACGGVVEAPTTVMIADDPEDPHVDDVGCRVLVVGEALSDRFAGGRLRHDLEETGGIDDECQASGHGP